MRSTPSKSTLIRIIAGSFLGGCLLLWSLSDIDLREFALVLKQLNWPSVGLIAAVYIWTYALRILRWQLMLGTDALGKSRVTFNAFAIGNFANNLVPGRMGDLLRAKILSKGVEKIGFSFAFASIVAEKLTDLVVVSIFLGVTATIAPLPSWLINAGIYLAAILLVVFLSLFVLTRLFRTSKVDNTHHENEPGRLTRVLSDFSVGINIFRSGKHPAAIALLSFTIWVSEVFGVYIAFYSLKLQLGLSAALVTIVAICISTMLPAAPGFVGTYQASVVGVLNLYGIPKHQSLAVGILLNLIAISLTSLAGLFAIILSTANNQKSKAPLL